MVSIYILTVLAITGCVCHGPGPRHDPHFAVFNADHRQVAAVLEAVGGVGDLDIVTISQSYDFGTGRVTKRSLHADGTVSAFEREVVFLTDETVILGDQLQIYSINNEGMSELFRMVATSTIIENSGPLPAGYSTGITWHFVGGSERVAVQYGHDFGINNVASIIQISGVLKEGRLSDENRLILGDDVIGKLGTELLIASDGINFHHIYQLFIELIDMAAQAMAQAKPGEG